MRQEGSSTVLILSWCQ